MQIGEAELLRDGQHFGFVFLDFVEADLVNLRGGQVGRGGAADEELVILCAVGQRRDAGLVATGGNVADLEEAGEAHVGGQDFFGDGGEHFGLDALLLGRRRWRRGKLLERQGERRVFGFLIG